MTSVDPIFTCLDRRPPRPAPTDTAAACARAVRRVLWPTAGDNRLYRFHHALMAMLSVLVLFAGFSNAANEDTTVQAVKAAFMFNFGKFASWPAETFSIASSPVRFCIYGDSLSPEVTDPLTGKTMQDRPVEVITVTDTKALNECHLLYLSANHADAAFGKVRSILKGLPVLTISDQEGFAHRGGHIGLFEEMGRLRFQINLTAVEDSSLDLSSKLLNLAEIVDRR